MATKKKKHISRFIKNARTAAILYNTAKETLPSIGDEETDRQVGYAGVLDQPGGKRRIYVKPESQKETAETYGLDLYTVAELDTPMSMVSDDFEQIPLDYESEYDDNMRTELRMNLGKLLDSL
jgi:hypothetical protein